MKQGQWLSRGTHGVGVTVSREPSTVSGSLPCHPQWTEGQRVSVFPSIIESNIEEGPQGSSEGTFREGVDEGAMVSDVVEGDSAGLIV